MKQDRVFKGFVMMALAFIVNYLKRFTGEIYLVNSEQFVLDALNWNYMLHQLAVIALAIAAAAYFIKAVAEGPLGKYLWWFK